MVSSPAWLQGQWIEARRPQDCHKSTLHQRSEQHQISVPSGRTSSKAQRFTFLLRAFLMKASERNSALWNLHPRWKSTRHKGPVGQNGLSNALPCPPVDSCIWGPRTPKEPVERRPCPVIKDSLREQELHNLPTGNPRSPLRAPCVLQGAAPRVAD